MSQYESSEQQINQGQSIDYKRLYQYERDIRQHYQKKVQLMQIRLKKIMLSKHKKSVELERRNSNQVIGELKNFKIQIPKSPRSVFQRQPLSQQRNSINNQQKYPLISNFAIFGIPDAAILDNLQDYNDVYEGDTIYASGNLSQTVIHAAKLVFPSGTTFQKLQGFQANKKCLQAMSNNYNTIKTFVLSFQPPQGCQHIGSNNGRRSKDSNGFNQNILNILNPEKRAYAVCLSIPQYTCVSKRRDNVTLSLQNTDENYQKLKSMKIITQEQQFKKSVSLFEIPDTQNKQDQQNQNICIAISERVYCIFSYYPIFSFFSDILKGLINLVKMQRLILFKQNSYKCIQQTDSSFSVRRMKQLYTSCVQKIGNLTSLKFNQIYEVKLINLQKVSLSTDLQSIKRKYITQWITPILRLFTLDKFIDVFTLIMLEEKVVFVCQNAHILTFLVFLFTNILPKPFYYPYPVVNMIPDQQEFLNAPFPIVYGYQKSKKSIVQEKIYKRFRNVYIIINKNGVQILSADSIKQTLNKKSYKLRQKLSSWFQKLHSQYIYNIKNSKNEQAQGKAFDFTCSKKSYETSLIILQQISHYMQNQIQANIPTRVQVQKIKKQLIKNLKEDHDVTHEAYKKINHIYSKRSKDPFFQQFLHTQLLNVHIFQ